MYRIIYRDIKRSDGKQKDPIRMKDAVKKAMDGKLTKDMVQRISWHETRLPWLLTHSLMATKYWQKYSVLGGHEIVHALFNINALAHDECQRAFFFLPTVPKEDHARALQWMVMRCGNLSSLRKSLTRTLRYTRKQMRELHD